MDTQPYAINKSNKRHTEQNEIEENGPTRLTGDGEETPTNGGRDRSRGAE